MMGEAAREAYAKLTDADPSHWRIVTLAKIEDGKWYDFFDVETGKFGQCMRALPGRWHQEPRGVSPTILEYVKPGNLKGRKRQ